LTSALVPCTAVDSSEVKTGAPDLSFPRESRRLTLIADFKFEVLLATIIEITRVQIGSIRHDVDVVRLSCINCVGKASDRKQSAAPEKQTL
jgi:hypothetical protein